MTTVTIRTPRCCFCNDTSTVMLDEEKYHRWQSGELIQVVWPEMSPEHRELLISGVHPQCFKHLGEAS